jgi:hypothetical protein
MKKHNLVFILLLVLVNSISAQKDTSYVRHRKIVKNGILYASWGYNTEWYTTSNIHIDQPGLGNNYTFNGIQAHDHRGWDDALLDQQPTIPEYNYRLGYFFDAKQVWALELNFDHAKYVVKYGYYSNITGQMNGQNVNTTVGINANVLEWQLNNGANWLELAIARRINFYEAKSRKLIIYSLIKVGAGPNIPHVQDVVFGEPNNQHFQVGGWNMGTEGALRLVFLKYFYGEFEGKLVYARYSQLHIYDGRAAQAFGATEIIANLGVCVPLGKGNADFSAAQ